MARFKTIKRSFEREKRVLAFRCYNGQLILRVYRQRHPIFVIDNELIRITLDGPRAVLNRLKDK